MEVVVRVEDGEHGNIKDVAELDSESASLQPVANPIVYKLVRVDIDGSLVPATDDELMEVENLLEIEKSDVVSVSDVSGTVGLGLDKGDLSEKPFSEQPRGSTQSKDAEGDQGNTKPRLEESFLTNAPGVSSRDIDHSQNAMDELTSHGGSEKSKYSAGQPDFSLLKGEIDLDRLSLRELQETFRATFGRETYAKDKMWLKRRIAMALTNSCDVDVTSFMINGGKFSKTGEDFCKTMVCKGSTTGEVCGAGVDIPVNSATYANLREDNVDGMAFTKSLSDSGGKSDDGLEFGAAKRVRKPTKRYIEELSDNETKDSSGKLNSPLKHSGQHNSLRPAVRPVWGVQGSAFVTRPDSIGGSGVQVPYVSRVRRCRPRKIVVGFTKCDSSDVAMLSKDVECSDAVFKPQTNTSGKTKLVDTTTVPFEELIPSSSPLRHASEDSRDKRCMTSISDSSLDRDPKDVYSGGSYTSKDNSATFNSDDNNKATLSTATAGMRRKHHRAWTLTEVMKLIDGVSRFGAGRWSEIKRLSFSSYSYRTSVDLKDKWRNLLKASFANPPLEKGMNPRKSGPPIPAPILLKVRELAEVNGQAPQIFRFNRDDDGSSVNESR